MLSDVELDRLTMTVLNLFGSQAVAHAQTIVVFVVIGILSLFAITTLVNIDPDLLSFSDHPSFRDIVSGVALTFFAFLGFGVITFTAKDLSDPGRQLPRAMYLALGLAMTVYVAVSLGVFGTLTVQEVIDSGGTAIAVAAEPTLGRAGYWLMSVTVAPRADGRCRPRCARVVTVTGHHRCPLKVVTQHPTQPERGTPPVPHPE